MHVRWVTPSDENLGRDFGKEDNGLAVTRGSLTVVTRRPATGQAWGLPAGKEVPVCQ